LSPKRISARGIGAKLPLALKGVVSIDPQKSGNPGAVPRGQISKIFHRGARGRISFGQGSDLLKKYRIGGVIQPIDIELLELDVRVPKISPLGSLLAETAKNEVR
jgi:hypothetical protein